MFTVMGVPAAAAITLFASLALAQPASRAPRDSSDALASAAWSALNHCDNPTSRAIAERCLAARPTDQACLEVAIAARTRMGDFAIAAPYVDRCLAAHPTSVQCWFARVTLDVHDRRAPDAERGLAHLRQLAPRGLWTTLAAAMVDELAGRLADAQRGFARACRAGQPYACARRVRVR